MKFALLILLVAGVLGPVKAYALDLPREQVEIIAKKAHELLPGAKISDDSIIGEERAKDLKYPLIPYDDIQRTVLRGYLSGFSAVCKLDWRERSFVPYMQSIRNAHKDWNDYQFAYVGTLHGLSMGNAEHSLSEDQCTNDFKANLEKSLLKAAQ
jgi:hypothetical protein